MSADTVRVKVHAGWGVSHNGKAYSGCAVLDLVSRPIEAPCVGCRGHLAPSFGGERAIAQVTTELTTWAKRTLWAWGDAAHPRTRLDAGWVTDELVAGPRDTLAGMQSLAIWLRGVVQRSPEALQGSPHPEALPPLIGGGSVRDRDRDRALPTDSGVVKSCNVLDNEEIV
jgi:hypothetical protein